MQRRIVVQSSAYIMLALLVLCVPLRWLCAIVVSILVHECGHGIMLCLCRCKVRQWKIGANGMQLLTEQMGAGKEFLCALAGPLCGALLLALGGIFPRLAMCALIHSVFNLLPITGLDGFRMLNSLLAACVDRPTAARIVAVIQFVFGVVFVVLGIWGCFLHSLGPFPLLFGIYVFVRCIPGKKPCKLEQETVQW